MKKVLLTSAVVLGAAAALQAAPVHAYGNWTGWNNGGANSTTPVTVASDNNRFGYGYAIGAQYIRYDRTPANGFDRHVRVTVVDAGGRPVPNVEVDFFLKPASQELKPEYFTATTDQSGDAELPTTFKAGEVIQYRVAKTATDFKEAVELVGELTVEAGTPVSGVMYSNGQIVLPYKLDDRAAQIGNQTTAAQYGWAQTAEGWKYFENAKAVTGWKHVDGAWYYFNAEGVMQKWWVKDGNTWYYLNGSGEMQTGWLQDGGKWYYLENTGAMKASQWFQVGDKWYYVDASGALAVNTTVDGYQVNENGEWV